MSFHPRSMLFVSGEKTERFAKAMAAGADLVCIDLEDAVHPARKAEARTQVLGWLKEHSEASSAPGAPRRALRINGLRTLEGLRDLVALAESGLRLDALLLPKTEAAADVLAVRGVVGAQLGGIVALLETAQGIEDAAAIARGSQSASGSTSGSAAPLIALMLGGADLSAELGASFDQAGLAYARGRLVNAAKAAGLQAWDVPRIALADDAGLAAETRAVLGLGFDCKTAIHPQQIATIHAAFRPTPAELDWARALLAAVPAGHDGGDGINVGAFLFDGRMVDAPLLKKAHRIAQRAALG
jgi:citrate lyase beta subunit